MKLYEELKAMDTFLDEVIPKTFRCRGRVEDVHADELTEDEKECAVRLWSWTDDAGHSFVTADLGNTHTAFVASTDDGLDELKELLCSEE